MRLHPGGPVAQLVIAVGQPALVVGLSLAGAWFSAHSSRVLGGLLFVIGLVLWLTSILLAAPLGWILTGAAATVIAAFAVQAGVNDAALYERGIRTSCTVLDIETRRVPIRTYDGEQWSTTTDTYYDHRLVCGDGREESLSLSFRAAGEGARLDVVHDPAGVVATQPAGEVSDGTRSAWIGAASLLAAVVARVLGVVHDGPPFGGHVRRGRDRRWRRSRISQGGRPW
ncbi:hypothetical protein DMH01_30875 [Amycolatopsis sp. WAC 04182]|uniref:hypothetical protein n=1 Tax=Amycolatopsis sp. WAC 04182 TaxID=2203198 RepID=UPI000F76914C|nr:hypothetical protein [Amycolatopsis sp. WAC 04182]RSN56203.1 hypothetical protein DMH01_30875 [Amycolatopsis sp. WAC 04182]